MLPSTVRRAVTRALGMATLAVALVAGDAAAATHGKSSHTSKHAAGHANSGHAKSGHAKVGHSAGHAKHASAAAKHGKSHKAKTSGKSASHTSRHGAASKHAAKAAKHATTRRDRHARRHDDEADETVAAAPTMPVIPKVVLPDVAQLFIAAGANQGAAPAAVGTPGALASFTRGAASLLDAMIARARSQLGTRYVFGGADPGAALDCSSFARYAMEALNIRLPRTAREQARVGQAVPRDPSMLRPGDLLTFGRGSRVSHVGIYLGEGRFIHASVKSGQVIETTIERNRSLFRRWQGARRLLATADSGSDATSGGG